MTSNKSHTLDEAVKTSTSTVSFGLTKDLNIPIAINIYNLVPSSYLWAYKHLVTPSEKYKDPTVFQRLSNIYINSDLFIRVQVVDGASNNPLTYPVQTPYQAFVGNRRQWNAHLKLPICFNQVGIDSYLRFEILEIKNTTPVLFGIGCVSLFNKRNSTLRSGRSMVAIHTDDLSVKRNQVEYGDIIETNELEEAITKYGNGEVPKVAWLDKISLSYIEEEKASKSSEKYSSVSEENENESTFKLYVEFPRLDIPYVYSETLFSLQSSVPHFSNRVLRQQNPLNEQSGTSVVINSVDIRQSKDFDSAYKVYDPDYQGIKHNTSIIQGPNNRTQNNNLSNPLDPIERKYHKLERNINNNSIFDKDLKPPPQLRDELLKILLKPSNIPLNDIEKNLIWKFRYYFSKNNAVSFAYSNNESRRGITSGNSIAKNSKLFLTKFLRSINWENDYELDHAFNEIIPNYWSVDKIEIGDSLELLGNNFNPFSLISSLRVNSGSTTPNDQKSNEISKLKRILKYVTFLRKFAVKRLQLANDDELLLYLLQLVQALKFEIYATEDDINKITSLPLNITIPTEDNLENSALVTFLIGRAVESEKLGNFFYWFMKVENEDQINNPGRSQTKIYSLILNRYINKLRRFSQINKTPSYNYLKLQIWFIKKLTSLVELIRTTFKKNEATARKAQYLEEYLANPSNEMLNFSQPFPLPLDPSVIVCGCYPKESSVFKSSLAPLKITLKTIENYGQVKDSFISSNKNKYGKYPLMFKIGDDLRQDQLVIQIINLMDRLLKNENLDLRLTPYKILATSPIAGLIQFVPNETLDAVLSNSYLEAASPATENRVAQLTAYSNSSSNVPTNGILNYLRLHSNDWTGDGMGNQGTKLDALPMSQQHAVTTDLGVSPTIIDNYVRSCAGYCVITYLLGVGDRHLDNLLLSPNGKFWHADFGYILGHDPKPFPPLMKLPIQVIDGMGGLNHENYNIFKNYCFITYTTLRKSSNLILNLFQLMLDANIPDIQMDPQRAVEKMQEKFCLEMTEEEAILHFQNLINDSVNAFLPVVIDRLHSLAQYWRA